MYDNPELNALVAQMVELSQRADEIEARRTNLPSTLKVSTEALDQASQQFSAYAAQIAQLVHTLETCTANLDPQNPNDHWLLAEMDNLLLPRLRYLLQGTQAWNQQLRRMSSGMQRAVVAVAKATEHVRTVEDVHKLVEEKTLLNLVDRVKNITLPTQEATDGLSTDTASVEAKANHDQ